MPNAKFITFPSSNLLLTQEYTMDLVKMEIGRNWRGEREKGRMERDKKIQFESLESLFSLGSQIQVITKCCVLYFLNLESVSPSL